jgi:L-ascorbate 6-phosphate lactonase
VPPTLTWLGQSGFLVETGGARLLIDPFFAEHEARRYPPPPIDDFGARIDRLLITHEHLDHLDAESLPRIAERSPGLVVLAPEPLRDQVGDVAFEGVRPGDVADVPGGRVTVVPAIHALHVADGYSAGGDPPRFAGFVLDCDGVTIYHAGDTIADESVIAALEPLDIDVALLPVNGRTYFREQQDVAGNLDVKDAVALAAHLGANVLAPVHWDLFEGNTERAGAAADEAFATGAPVHVVTLMRGVPWVAAVPPRG